MDDKTLSGADNESNAYSGENFYKKQLEASNKEKAQLQERLRDLETKNASLLKSLFELSCLPASSNSMPLPMDVIQALKRFSLSNQQMPVSSGKGSAYRRSAPTDRAVVHHPSDAGVIPHISPDYVPFRNRADLIGHDSAVYAVQFSPNGELLISVSFDKSVCFWPMDKFLEKSTYDPKRLIPDAHRAPIVAAEWTFDSARALTGGLDQSVAEWDIESKEDKPVSRFACNGLVNSVSVSPANDMLFFVATSKSAIHLFDRRVPPPKARSAWEPFTIVMNDIVVNTIHVTIDGSRFITGDLNGAVKTWDVRMVGSGKPDGIGGRKAGLVNTAYNDDNRQPITHIHTSPPTQGEEYGRFMAVNSYDDYLRVYDRGSFLFKDEKPELKPVHALRGVDNMHWPIKSSFFLGADYRSDRRRPRRQSWKRRTRETLNREGEEGYSKQGEYESGYESILDGDDEQLSCSTSSDEENDRDEEDGHIVEDTGTIGGSIQSTLVLASGSADSKVYIFDVGGPKGTGALLQTLEGHRDRVYAVDFHPHEPILASCSADSEIKIWHSFR